MATQWKWFARLKEKADLLQSVKKPDRVTTLPSARIPCPRVGKFMPLAAPGGFWTIAIIWHNNCLSHAGFAGRQV
jgi:hypothetical protein